MRQNNALLLATLGLAAASPSVLADDYRDGRDERRIVTVAFGAGLNTAQPGNAANHHVIPQIIRVGVGDVVNFVVAGLHVIRVYDDGVRLRDVTDQLPDECEVNPLPMQPFPPQCEFSPEVPVIPDFGLPVYYEGINPLAAPPPAPPFAQASAAVNRVEPVAFLEPGRYLVICAVLPHFNDRMIALVDVRRRSDGAPHAYDGR
jgi:hypothetical protein